MYRVFCGREEAEITEGRRITNIRANGTIETGKINSI